MAMELVGGSVSLAANGSGKIQVEYARDGQIVEFLVNSTGRAEISSIEQEAVEDYVTGTIELDALKKKGNVYELPVPIEYKSGSKLTVSLTDLSGAANDVYFAFLIKYGE